MTQMDVLAAAAAPGPRPETAVPVNRESFFAGAVKEFKFSYHNPETISFTVYP